MSMRKITIGAATLTAVVLLSAGPAFAHECFNPKKDANAPTAGVNYTVVGFDQNGPIFVQTGPGKGIGGYAAIAPGVFGPDQTETVYVHTLGNTQSGRDLVGGPGSQTAGKACDGKGIDYLDACFGL